MTHQIKVTIGGETYQLSSPKENNDVKLAVELLNKDWRQLEKLQPHITKHQRAVLLALNSKLDAIESERKHMVHEIQWENNVSEQEKIADYLAAHLDKWLHQTTLSNQDHVAMRRLLNELQKNKIKGHR